MDFSALQKLLGGSAIGAGAYGLFGHQNDPSKAANKYISQIPGQTQQYYQPWMEAGQNELPQLQGQYGELMSNPGEKLNDIGGQFHESPGFKFALQQALQGAGHAAAAGGMAGTPQHEQQNMQLGNDIANQDYYNWLGKATGLYGEGLQGAQGLAGMGQQAGQSMADQIAQALATQGKLAYEGQAQKNQNKGGAFGNLLGGLSSFLF